MASYIKTLKEDNGDITYPQTLGSAVLLTGGADLETELAGKASAASVAGKIDIGDVQSSDITAGAVTTAKIDDGAVTAAKVDWSTVFERQTFTVTLDSTGNAEIGVNTADYWILAISQIGSGAFVNGNVVPYSWSDGKYYIHVDQNYGHAYSTGTITVEALLLSRSVIGF